MVSNRLLKKSFSVEGYVAGHSGVHEKYASFLSSPIPTGASY